MSLITRVRRQNAVYWTPETKRDDYGKVVHSEPVEIECRWDDSNERFINAKGEEITSSASVIVDREVEVGGYLWLGTLAALEETELDTTQPMKVTGAHTIKTVTKNPNLRNTETLIKAIL